MLVWKKHFLSESWFDAAGLLHYFCCHNDSVTYNEGELEYRIGLLDIAIVCMCVCMCVTENGCIIPYTRASDSPGSVENE